MASMTYTGNLRSTPAFLGDFANREHVIAFPARLDATAFTSSTGVVVTLTANAAQAATSITVTALSYGPQAATTLVSQGNVLIPAGTVLYFGGAKIATTTADAVYGATTIAVAALPTALVTTDTATYNRYGTLFVPAGTLVGRTYAERASNAGFGPAVVASDDEQFLTLTDAVNVRNNADVELIRIDTLIKENYLPGYGTGLLLGTTASPTATLTKIRALYQCIQGQD